MLFAAPAVPSTISSRLYADKHNCRAIQSHRAETGHERTYRQLWASTGARGPTAGTYTKNPHIPCFLHASKPRPTRLTTTSSHRCAYINGSIEASIEASIACQHRPTQRVVANISRSNKSYLPMSFSNEHLAPARNCGTLQRTTPASLECCSD